MTCPWSPQALSNKKTARENNPAAPDVDPPSDVSHVILFQHLFRWQDAYPRCQGWRLAIFHPGGSLWLLQGQTSGQIIRHTPRNLLEIWDEIFHLYESLSLSLYIYIYTHIYIYIWYMHITIWIYMIFHDLPGSATSFQVPIPETFPRQAPG